MSTLIIILSWSIGAIATAWGLYRAADAARGVYVQTFPEVGVVGSDAKSPFSLPFYVLNQSGWFSLSRLSWSCGDIKMIYQTNTYLIGSIQKGSPTDFRPGEKKLYTCGIGGVGSDGLASLSLTVTVKYKVLWFDRPDLKTKFTWKSNQWIKGDFAN